jgi:hypothetical protein
MEINWYDQWRRQADPIKAPHNGDTKTGRRNGVSVQRTCTMETNNGVSKVGVQPHSRGQGNGQIGKQAHAKGRQSRNGSCRGNQITPDFLDTESVLGVGLADGVVREAWADASTTSV